MLAGVLLGPIGRLIVPLMAPRPRAASPATTPRPAPACRRADVANAALGPVYGR